MRIHCCAAGEEADGTIGLLLANPRSRRHLLMAKSSAMSVLVASGAVLTLGGSYLAPAILNVNIGASNLLAVSLHLLFNAVIWGAIATAVGAASGNRSLAVAVSTGAMVVSYFLVGLLPLVNSLADLAKVLPWYWFDGHDPLNNGINLTYLTLQAGLIVILFGVAWWGIETRDLSSSTGTHNMMVNIVDRLRRDEHAARLVNRLSGSARVGSIWAKTAAEGKALVLVVGFVMFTLMGLMMGPMYTAMEDTLASLAADLPENLLAIFGGGDISTPQGWYQVETFSLMAPIAVALVASAVGARALGGEEHARTMGLLLANPLTRRRVVLEKLVALAAHTTTVGIIIFAGVAGGSLLGQLDMSIAHIGAASLQVTLLGLMFGTLALAIGAATGSVHGATIGTIGAFSAAYAINSILAVAQNLEGWKWLSPFHWYLGNNPLNNGLDWVSVSLFTGFSTVFVVAAIVLFDRRDLRHG